LKPKGYITQFANHYHALAVFERSAGRNTFNETVKMHHLVRIGMNCVYDNPRMSTEYGYEDLVGRVSRLGKSCTASMPHHRIAAKCLRKLRSLMALLLDRMHGRLSNSLR